VREAKLERTDEGAVPKGPGWFVVNAREARWLHTDELGSYCGFEGPDEARFEELGINLNVLQPGQPMAMYHADRAQEDFLVLAGEALLVVEDEERPLRAWDFFHCPTGTAHVIVGAGESPCVVLATGARSKGGELVYPVSQAALVHGAGVEEQTTEPSRAYARFAEPGTGPYREGDLPGI
jgi:uncharacterized cupin superfamily protein